MIIKIDLKIIFNILYKGLFMSKDYKFQALSWIEKTNVSYEFDANTEEEKELKRHVVEITGRDEENKTVFLMVEDYNPYFYIKKPDYWNSGDIRKYISHIKNNLSKKILYGFINYEIIENYHDFVGFTNNSVNTFIKLIFKNMNAYYSFRKYIKETLNYEEYILKKGYEIKIYESKIKAFLNFIHEKNLKTCGWLNVKNYKKIKNKSEKTINDINIVCNFDDVEFHEETKMSKFIILSFDIETYNPHGLFPKASNDEDCITQIGSVFTYYGETEPFLCNIITLNGCKRIKGLENVEIKECSTEKKVLLEWTKLIKRINPDIIVGYNINNFDLKYMHDRAQKLNILNEFSMLDRHINQISKYIDGTSKSGSSKAFGDNELYYYEFEGRTLIDLFSYAKRNIPLPCYKLDFVASVYIREKIIKYENFENECIITTNSIYGLKEDQYINISYFDGLTDNTHTQKYKIIEMNEINEKEKTIKINGNIPLDLLNFKKLAWCHAKDDLSAQDMFKLFKESDEGRGIIAKYCIMDCILVLKLLEKLQVLNNNIGMANVCYVPLTYIFMRGQSIKAHSLISKFCKDEKHLIPDIDPPEDYGKDDAEKEKYEGAIVFDPKEIKLYNEEPVVVLDFGSLYPSTAICYNISHETLVLDKKYENLDNYIYHEIKFEVNGIEEKWKYAEPKDGKKGIIPRILDGLLKKRKAVKKEMETCTDPFLYKILDGLQNAYKVTANSIYGLLGAVVSPVYLAPLAPSITAGGRGMLEYARTFINDPFNKLVNLSFDDDNKKYKSFSKKYFKKYPEYKFVSENYKNKKEFIKYFRKKTREIVNFDKNKDIKVNPDVIYGDTDSVFFVINYNKKIEKKLMTSINFGKLAGETICKTLPEPEKMVYEKTMFPFIILAKKKYVGNLYEDDDTKFYQKNMGIVLKRRDNAKIVKVAVGGIVDYMLNKNNNKKAIDYIRTILKNILRDVYPIDYFVISKTLKKTYKNRKGIAHACLADRITERDPGNKPNVNDRIEYLYYITKTKSKLQGDKIEDPNFLIQNNLKIDYIHYIKNQIEKPALQFLKLISKNPEKIFKNYVDSESRRRKGQKPIVLYFNNTDNDEVNEDEEENIKDTSDSISFNDDEIKTIKKKNFSIYI